MIPDVSLPYDILKPGIQPPPFVPSQRFFMGTGNINGTVVGCGSAPAHMVRSIRLFCPSMSRFAIVIF